MTATFTASATPLRQSVSESVGRKSASFTTARGGAKVPRKFLQAPKSTPFLTPTPASACDRVVVFTRMTRHPRWMMPAA